MNQPPKIASDYYLNWMVWTGIIAVTVMITTFVFITETFPQTTQGLAATIAVAFEGFIFGGAFQYLLEGRRIQHQDRMNRIRAYHDKLKTLVIDFWKGRNVEPRNTPDSPFPNERLTAFLDLDSNNDPDSRYLNALKEHLRNPKYSSVAQTRDTIRNLVVSHNGKAKDLSDSAKSLIRDIEGLGFKTDTIWPAGTHSPDILTIDSLYRFLEQYHQDPVAASLRIDNSNGPSTVKYFYGEHEQFSLATSPHSKRNGETLRLIESFAPKYTKSKKELEDSLKALQNQLESFIKQITPIGYDIEDRIFSGSCSFEKLVRSSEEPE